MDKENILPIGKLPERNETVLKKLKAEYNQKLDDCDESQSDFQKLKIFTEDAGAGTYFIIETKRWSFNDIDDLLIPIKDFMNKLNITE